MSDVTQPAPLSKSRYAFLLRLGMWRGVAVVTVFSTVTSLLLVWASLAFFKVPEERMFNWLVVSVLVPLVVSGIVGVVMMSLLIQLDAAHREVQRLAITDGLTGLYNRRHFMALAEAAFRRARVEHAEMAVMMIDADHFKAVNDLHGHAVGDEVLRSIGAAAQRTVRVGDALARYGGEEFVLLLPATGGAAALEIAQRLRAGIAASAIAGAQGAVIHVTVSIGLAPLTPQIHTLDALLGVADAALYRAKAEGRNRIVVA